jgi:hypothetical protein
MKSPPTKKRSARATTYDHAIFHGFDGFDGLNDFDGFDIYPTFFDASKPMYFR